MSPLKGGWLPNPYSQLPSLRQPLTEPQGVGVQIVCTVSRECAQSCRLFVTLWTVALQAPLSLELSRQEYWSGLPFPSPGDLSDPATELTSPEPPALQVASLPLEPLGLVSKCLSMACL